MSYAYATGENRVWTARDERELKAEHERATRATHKHLSDLQSQVATKVKSQQSPGAEERSFMDKILRRRNTGNLHSREPSQEVNSADLPPEKRPLPPKVKQPQEGNPYWWGRGHRQTSSLGSRVTIEREPYTPLGVANSALPPPPIPPRYDLDSRMTPIPPHRIGRKSEHDSHRVRRKSDHDARRKARERALHLLETDQDVRRIVPLERRELPPIHLKPGTWMPGQINVVDFDKEVIAADKRVDVDEFGGSSTPQIVERFPPPPRSLPPRKNAPLSPLPPAPSGQVYTNLPPTRPLYIVHRRMYQDVRDIPIPPIPAEPEKSNRESFIELRRKRSYRV